MAAPTPNYSQHRPNDFYWMAVYVADMGKQAFEDFLNRVFDRLMKMEVGETYDLTTKVSKKNRDLFIKLVCYYMQCGNMDYEFSDDYTTIIRREKIRVELFAKKKQQKEKLEDSNI